MTGTSCSRAAPSQRIELLLIPLEYEPQKAMDSQSAENWPTPNDQIHYEKGEQLGKDRTKHLGKADEADVVRENGTWVGKCPKGFPKEMAEALLRDAVPEFNKNRPEHPRALWAVYQGAVYIAFSSDHGTHWHGFPTNAEPPRKILRALRERADREGQGRALKKWLERKWK